MERAYGTVSEERLHGKPDDRKPSIFVRVGQKLAKAALPGRRQLTKYIVGSTTRGSHLSFGLSLAPELQSQEPPLLLAWSENCFFYPAKGPIAYLTDLPAVAQRQARWGSSRRFQNDRKAFGLLW